MASNPWFLRACLSSRRQRILLTGKKECTETTPNKSSYLGWILNVDAALDESALGGNRRDKVGPKNRLASASNQLVQTTGGQWHIRWEIGRASCREREEMVV